MPLSRVAQAFLESFPVPEYLSEPGIGCDISDHAVRYVELTRGERGLRMSRFGTERFPEGVIVGGDIRDGQAAAEVLRTLQAGGSIPAAHFSLPIEKTFLFHIDIPGLDLDPRAVRSICEFKLEENLPIAPQEALFDCVELSKNRETATTDVSVAAVARTTVADYIALFEAAGIEPLSLEVESDSVARAVVPQGSDDTVMVVDFGARKTGLSITRRGSVVFTSGLDFGSDHLTDAVSTGLSLARGDAEALKRKTGLTPLREDRRVFTVLSGQLAALAAEIGRHLTYWRDETRGRTDSITRLILCGGGANLPGLADFLSRETSVPAVIADVWANVFSVEEEIPPIPFEDALSYAGAIGLALRRFPPNFS